MAKENREHKSSVFADLFYDDQEAKENLLSLYNALNDTTYKDSGIIQLVRLENVLFKNFINDVAFTVKDQKIIISEHQSTVPPNLPLRDLMYIAREYEKIIPVRKRYSSSLIQIPRPQFVTFYNGNEDYPKEKILKLSDAFKTSPDGHNGIALELTVRVININLEKRHPLLQKCDILNEYSQFVSIVKQMIARSRSLEDAVKDCIKHGILKSYLQRKSSEVINMLMAEYDYDMDVSVQREEAEKKATETTNQLNDLILSTILQNPSASTDEIVQLTHAPAHRVMKIQEILKTSAKNSD